MPSYPLQTFENGSSPHLQHADPPAFVVQTNEHAAQTPSQTASDAGTSHGASSSQVTIDHDFFNTLGYGAYPSDIASMMPSLHDSQHNLHHTALGPHAPSWNLENSLSSNSIQTAPPDFSNDLYFPPQSYELYTPTGTSYPTSHTEGYDYFTSALPDASWAVPEQDAHFFLPQDILPAQQSEFRQLENSSFYDTGNYDISGPRLIQNSSQMIVPTATVQSQVAHAVPLRQSLDESYYPRQGLPANVTAYDPLNNAHPDSSSANITIGGYQDDNHVEHIPDIAVGMHNPAPRVSTSLVHQKRKCDSEAPGSRKRSRPNEVEPSSHSLVDDDTQGRCNGTKQALSYERFDRDLSQRGSSSVRRSSPPGSGLMKGGAGAEFALGFFPYSSNFVVKQPFMIDHSQHHHTQGDQPDGTLLWLKDYIMEGAEFDSSARDPPPRCHPNTRASIIERTINWIKDPFREKSMRWVRGTAGVGKSAIVQTVFETIPEELRGGSVFLSRPNGRNNPKEVFPSFAYQLGVRDPSYRAYLKELMLKDPQSLKKSMKEQFRILFEEPFVERKLRHGQGTLLIALDGLDECGGNPTRNDADQSRSRGKSSEDAQCEIVELVSNFILQHPSVPLIWIIASRPEKHLQVMFASEKVEPTFTEEEIPVDSVEACKDVEKYLNSEFTRIRKKHDDFITTTPWPSSKDFSLITTKASGLFIFAQVIIRFIDESNPIQQLKYALNAISKVSATNIKENPLVVLDAMYLEIVSRVPHEWLEPATKIIGTIVLFEQKYVRGGHGTLPLICNILDISKDIAFAALRQLHSVLFFPKASAWILPSFYHASFRDFLEDESRSHEFSVKQFRASNDLFDGLMRFSGKTSLNDVTLPWPGEGELWGLIGKLREDNPLSFVNGPSFPFFEVRLPVSEHKIVPHMLNSNFVTDIQYVRLGPIIDASEKELETYERHGITCYKPIDALGITCDTISKCETNGHHHSGLNFVFSLDKDELSISRFYGHQNNYGQHLRPRLYRWIKANPKRLVRVWGREKFKRAVVIDLKPESGELDLGDYQVVAFVGF